MPEYAERDRDMYSLNQRARASARADRLYLIQEGGNAENEVASVVGKQQQVIVSRSRSLTFVIAPVKPVVEV